MADGTQTISEADALALLQEGLIAEGGSRQFDGDSEPNPDAQRATRAKAVEGFGRDIPGISGTTFGRQVAKGFVNIGETSLGFFEALSDILGAKGAKAFYKDKGDRLAELNAAIPTEIQSVTDIGSLADAGGFAAMAVGQLAPQIATSLLGGLAARGLAAGRGPLAQLAATVGGAVAPATVQEAGGIYRGVREETGVEAPFTSLALGSISGALEAVTPARFLLKVFDSGTDELKKKTLASLLKGSAKEIWKEAKELGSDTAKEIVKAGATEFGTEAVQEAIQIGANKFADSTYDVINSKNAWRVLDAGLMGLVGGAALGSVEPSVERAIEHVKKQEEQNAANERQKQKDDSGERRRVDQQLQADTENRVVPPEVAATSAETSGGNRVSESGQVAQAEPETPGVRRDVPALESQVTPGEKTGQIDDAAVVPKVEGSISAPAVESTTQTVEPMSTVTGQDSNGNEVSVEIPARYAKDVTLSSLDADGNEVTITLPAYRAEMRLNRRKNALQALMECLTRG